MSVTTMNNDPGTVSASVCSHKNKTFFLLIQNRIFSAGAAVAQRVEQVGSWLEVRSFKSQLRAELSTP